MRSEDLVYEITQTSAIFGRNSETSVSFQGDMAYTDGKEIVLPSLPQGMEFTNEEVLTLRGYLDHEAGHIRHTDFTLLEKFVNIHGEQAKRIWNCLEDVWLESRVMKEYPGSEKNLCGLMDSIADPEAEFISRHPELFGEKPTIQNVCSAITTIGRDSYTSNSFKEKVTSLISDKFKAWGHRWREEVLKCKNTKEIMNMALEIKKLLDESSEKEKRPDKNKASSGLKGLEEVKVGSVLEGDPKDFSFNPDGDPINGDSPKNPEEVEDNTEKAPSESFDQFCDKLLKDKINKYLKTSPSDKKVKYRVLTTKHDEVFHKNSTNKRTDKRLEILRKGTASDYDMVKSSITGQVNTMKSKLRRALMAKERRDWDFGREFGRIDTKRLAAGFQGSQNVFKQLKDREEINTSVLLLVDMSGSMNGKKMKTARDSVVAFCECLEGTQIRYEVNGFDNKYRYSNAGYVKLLEKARRGSTTYHRTEPLNIFQFKKFEETLRVAKGPVSTIDRMARENNSDRDAVLWCLQRLSKQRTERKILIVLSDGQPAHEYIRLDYYTASEILKRALKDVVVSAMKDYGVQCVGIGIEDNSVTEIYEKSVVINSVSDLSGVVFTKLSELLTGGSVRL